MAQLEVEFLHECFRTNFSGCVSPIMKLLVIILFRNPQLLFFRSRNCIRMKRNSAHRPGQGPSKIYLLARKLERQSHLEPHFEAPGFCVVLPDNKEAAELFNSIIDENLRERSSTSRGKTMMVEDVHLLKRFWRN
ncbi:hypothetical protein OIU78_020817 [Salix suchowensis]|nr:hypothetical protein OIU78_020817 [Salix suchowensis]